MRVTYRLTFAIILAGLLAQSASADTGFVLSVGENQIENTTWRVGLQGDFQRTLWSNQTGSVRLTPYWDAGYTDLSGTDAEVISFSPLLRLSLPRRGRTYFLEGGIGVAWFSDRVLDRHFDAEKEEIGSRDLGSRWNLEDRLGLGVLFAGGNEFGVRFIHYSNADLASPNDGVNVYLVHWYFPF